jgi:small GTP-binding protein
MPTAARELKLVVLGTGGVGKSALSMQYVQSIFVDTYDPTIEDSYRKIIEVPTDWLPNRNTTTMVLDIMDTAGTDQFTAMRDIYMQNGDAFLLVYSIDSMASFDALTPLYEQLLRVKGAPIGNIPTLLIGNKCDLTAERQVGKQQAKLLAERWKLPLPMETSARQNINVDEAFMQLVKLALVNPKRDKRKEANRPSHKNKCVFM